MRAFLPLALLAVTACYSPRTAAPSPGAYDDQSWLPAPLEASLYYDEFTGHARFHVSRPASVAMFALRPGGGMEMIYPAMGMGIRTNFSDGYHIVRTSGSPYRLTGNWSMAQGHGPMYILLVAADEPLDVDRFRLRNRMSWLDRTAITYNPHMALEALVGEIVPRPNTTAWTTAMHVVWPMEMWPRPERQRHLRVRCANGMEILAPSEAVIAGYPLCPEQLERPDSASDSTVVVPRRSKPDSASTDALRAVVPPRSRPPEDWMTTRIGDVDLRSELRRLREINGKSDPGVLEIRPYPELPPRDRPRGVAGRHRAGGSGSGVRTRGVDRPDVERSRPAARPASRPVTRPAPAARPAPQRDPPKSTRPSRPTKPTKPTKPGGGDS